MSPVLVSWLRRNHIRRLRRLARAARIVRQGADPFANIALVSMLEQAPLRLPERAFARLEDLGLRDAAIHGVRQRLTNTVLIKQALPGLLPYVAGRASRVALGLPPAWRQQLAAAGVAVDASGSRRRWYVNLVLFYLHAVKSACEVVRFARTSARVPAAPYAVMPNVRRANLPPAPAVDGAPGDFASWLRQSSFWSPNAELWGHIPGTQVTRVGGVTVTPYPLPALPRFADRLALVARLVGALAAAAWRGLSGDWWEVVAAEQLVHLEYARRLPPTAFARAYFFNNAVFVLRPLWTYLAERHGAAIHLVFYSTNIEVFGLSPAHPRPDTYGYRSMTWPRYAVWDAYIVALLHRLGHVDRAIEIVGPVGFTDAPGPLVPLPEDFIAVFDVMPQRPASLAARGIPQPYYTTATWARFMRDVDAAAASLGFGIVYKKKREIGKIAAAQFRSDVTALAARARDGRTVVVDPDTAPRHLIRRARAVVSMPFTSTAYVAREMGKPSVFYDPCGALTDEHRLAHGVRVIGNLHELTAWLHAAVAAVPSGA